MLNIKSENTKRIFQGGMPYYVNSAFNYAISQYGKVYEYVDGQVIKSVTNVSHNDRITIDHDGERIHTTPFDLLIQMLGITKTLENSVIRLIKDENGWLSKNIIEHTLTKTKFAQSDYFSRVDFSGNVKRDKALMEHLLNNGQVIVDNTRNLIESGSKNYYKVIKGDVFYQTLDGVLHHWKEIAEVHQRDLIKVLKEIYQYQDGLDQDQMDYSTAYSMYVLKMSDLKNAYAGNQFNPLSYKTQVMRLKDGETIPFETIHYRDKVKFNNPDINVEFGIDPNKEYEMEDAVMIDSYIKDIKDKQKKIKGLI